jgi:mannitol/fructose-specific phosphotransferase system IIA component (Ntr-type)
MFERWGQLRYSGLDAELRGILKEKGLREEDPFDEVVARSLVIDLDHPVEFEDVTRRASEWLSGHVPHTADEIEKQLLDRTHIGATPVTHGVGLPHLKIDGIEHGEMVLVRSNHGIHIQFTDPLTGHEAEERLTAIFFLFSPEHDPSQHLRVLAQIARRVDDESFLDEWQSASNELELKEALLHNEDFLSLTMRMNTPTSELIGRALRDVAFPDGCLVALLRRGGSMLIPRGDTILQEDDRLTILGAKEGLDALTERFQPH